MESREIVDASDSGPPSAVVEDLLADEQCRAVLSRLADTDGPVLVEDLACVVAASGQECSVTDVSVAERRRSRKALFVAPLPRLTATRVVKYDSRLDAVELLDERVASRLD
ncbi:hypothetical protein ACKVMT_02130 [Halobacteriales archaeon Cl-PHB]